jgi:hypothetical protein
MMPSPTLGETLLRSKNPTDKSLPPWSGAIEFTVRDDYFALLVICELLWVVYGRCNHSQKTTLPMKASVFIQRYGCAVGK